ncbi:peptidase S8/S53 domain-containing protein [Lipomyces orientalis]|uniref:Peptidase S8/S53 domain-containing protein n=1 Tax=Lipomyces orientalis TaxID=1233043 RepID=A0ACC3U0D6_9ASCO
MLLLIIALSIVSVVPQLVAAVATPDVLLDPRTHVLPREYDARDYYAVEIDWNAEDLVNSDCDLACRIDDFANEMGLRFEEPLGSLKNHYLFSAPKSATQDGAAAAAVAPEDHVSTKLRKRSGGAQPVQYFEKMKTKRLYKRDLPDRYAYDRPIDSSLLPLREIEEALDIHDPLFEQQWHLMNPLQPGHDVNVSGVWLQNITGAGVAVAIVDDGLDFDSDDLKDNFFAQGSYDFNDHVALPRPRLADDRHGTRCAGEIAAVKNNVCGLGVAYDSKVAGIRILSKEITDVDEALALNHKMQDNHIYSCSWGPPDDGQSMDAPGVLIKRAFINGVQNGRNGLGSVFVFASGNGARNGDNCNFDGYTNSIYSITVGALDRKGLHPYYSEDCSALFVVTYSSGSGDFIHTTDVGKQACADNHGGTSAAAPLAAGIFSLVLSIRPDLSWRDMQYLALQSAVKVDNTDALWQKTANGRDFSHRYGYGKLDTYAIVEAAKTFEKVKPQAWFDTPVEQVHTDIPFGKDGVSSSITIDRNDLVNANLERLEHVQVTVNIRHQRRGDLSVRLTSPFGTVSLLATTRVNDNSNEGMVDWTFMSVAHWGESGVGTWTLTVDDKEKPDLKGTFEDWTMRIWGEAIDPSRAKPFPMPKAPGDSPSSTTTVSTPTPIPTTSTTTSEAIPTTSTTSTELPVASTTVSAPSPTSTGDYSDNDDDKQNDRTSAYFSWIPTFGMSTDKVVWIYGAALLIIGFIALMTVYFCVQRHKKAGLRRAGDSDGYEFQVLRNRNDLEAGNRGNGNTRAGGRRKTRDLYDAFENIDEDDAFAVEDILSEAEDDQSDDGRDSGAAVGKKGGGKSEPEEDKERLLGGQASGS